MIRYTRWVCIACDETADEDEEPAYCPHCGWDGLNYNLDEVANADDKRTADRPAQSVL